MKTIKIIGMFTLLMFSLSGCYTQIAKDNPYESEYSKIKSSNTESRYYSESDTTYSDENGNYRDDNYNNYSNQNSGQSAYYSDNNNDSDGNTYVNNYYFDDDDYFFPSYRRYFWGYTPGITIITDPWDIYYYSSCWTCYPAYYYSYYNPYYYNPYYSGYWAWYDSYYYSPYVWNDGYYKRRTNRYYAGLRNRAFTRSVTRHRGGVRRGASVARSSDVRRGGRLENVSRNVGVRGEVNLDGLSAGRAAAGSRGGTAVRGSGTSTNNRMINKREISANRSRVMKGERTPSPVVKRKYADKRNSVDTRSREDVRTKKLNLERRNKTKTYNNRERRSYSEKRMVRPNNRTKNRSKINVPPVVREKPRKRSSYKKSSTPRRETKKRYSSPRRSERSYSSRSYSRPSSRSYSSPSRSRTSSRSSYSAPHSSSSSRSTGRSSRSSRSSRRR